MTLARCAGARLVGNNYLSHDTVHLHEYERMLYASGYYLSLGRWAYVWSMHDIINGYYLLVVLDVHLQLTINNSSPMV